MEKRRRCAAVGFAGVDRRERAFWIALGVTAYRAAPLSRAPLRRGASGACAAGRQVGCPRRIAATILKSLRISREHRDGRPVNLLVGRGVRAIGRHLLGPYPLQFLRVDGRGRRQAIPLDLFQ